MTYTWAPHPLHLHFWRVQHLVYALMNLVSRLSPLPQRPKTVSLSLNLLCQMWPPGARGMSRP